MVSNATVVGPTVTGTQATDGLAAAYVHRELAW